MFVSINFFFLKMSSVISDSEYFLVPWSVVTRGQIRLSGPGEEEKSEEEKWEIPFSISNKIFHQLS